MSLDKKTQKKYRSIGHHLNPVVIVANGLGENVLAEINRALNDHELIKVKLALGDREEKVAAIETLTEVTGATLVQAIGNIILIYRPAAKPNPKLSNILRANLL